MTTVLVVDDMPRGRRMIRFSVERDSVRVIEAADGDTAWALLAAERPDLVILDIELPGASGLDICRSMRAGVAFTRVPVIILTACTSTSATQAGAAGVSAFMMRPFSPAALLDLVAALGAA